MNENTNENTNELDLLRIYAQAWNTLDPEILAPYLSENIVYESQNILNPLTGKENLLELWRAKMQNIKNGGLEHKVFSEIGYTGSQQGNTVQLLSAPGGRPCVVVAQGNKGIPIALVLLEVKDNLIERIDICTVVPHPLAAKRTGEYPGLEPFRI